MRRVDLSGMQFNRLIVSSTKESRQGRIYWLCKCTCGNEKWVSTKLLRNGECGSCGCLRQTGTQDLTGQTFGRLTVTAKNKRKKRKVKHKDEYRYRFYWLCSCECGGEVWVESSRLKTQLSCGCLRIEKISLPPGQAAKNRFFRKYKWSAEQRSLCFKLTYEDTMEISKQNCFYCNEPPSRDYSQKADNGSFICNGIDRVDNTIGYIKENCVSCCVQCNKMKRDLTEDFFLSKIEKIYINKINKDLEKRCVFVGRWQPFHISHEALIRSKLDKGAPCLVLVRATPVDKNNPYTLEQTIKMIRAAFDGENVKVLPISDISGIYYGRKVGYLVEEIDMPDTVKRISATKIRECLNNNDDTWRDFVNPNVAKVLEEIHQATLAINDNVDGDNKEKD